MREIHAKKQAPSQSPGSKSRLQKPTQVSKGETLRPRHNLSSPLDQNQVKLAGSKIFGAWSLEPAGSTWSLERGQTGLEKKYVFTRPKSRYTPRIRPNGMRVHK